ncbi:MAG: WG repeat-containing protein, partial [Fervidobacterium sp.]
MKKILIVLLLLTVLFTSCNISKNTTQSELPALIPYRVGKKWGFCDKDKKIIVEPVYREAHLFSEGLALVNLDGKFGYINDKGEMVIEPSYNG